MSGPVYVDTGAWYALQVPDDEWHELAVATLQRLMEGGGALCTSNLVIGETYTLLRRTHGHAAAWRFLDILERSASLERVHVDAELERQAFAILRRYEDQDFSFVDGTSFAVMRHRRLRRAFAFDHHFVVLGFTRVPLDEPRASEAVPEPAPPAVAPRSRSRAPRGRGT